MNKSESYPQTTSSSQETNDFIRQHLIDYFGITQKTTERPGGLYRNADNHTGTFADIEDYLLHEKYKYNKRKAGLETGKLTFQREDVPRVMTALSQQGLVGYANAYSRVAFFEALIPNDQAVEQLEADQ